MLRYLIAAITLLHFAACLPPKNEEITTLRLDLKDPVYRSIIDLQDKQQADSLYFYLKHPDPSYRYASTMAFASFKSDAAVDSLLPLLHDAMPQVRQAAAFALGQIGDKSATNELITAFNALDTLPANNEINTTILAAIGKCGDQSHLLALSTVSTYRPTDTLLLFGQAKAIYNYALRDIVLDEGTEKMVDFVSSNIYPEPVRLVAANYMRRAKNIDLKSYKSRLNKAFLEEDSPFIKMDLAIALGKTKNPDVLNSLLDELKKNNDYRVKTNILRALGNFTYIDVVETVLDQLKNPNIHIAESAANFLIDYGQPNDVIIYRRKAKEELPWQVKTKVYQAIIKHVPAYFSKTKSASLWEIRKQIETSVNPYEKAAYIKALSYDIQSLRTIRDIGFGANEFAARTASVEAMNRIISREDLEEKMNRYQFRRFKTEVADMIRQAFESEDSGMIALAAIGFKDCTFDLNEVFEDLEFIKTVKNKLTLPTDIETYNEILKLEAFLANKEYKAVSIGFNHPIDWKVFDALNLDSKAVVETDRGTFEINLLSQNAPGSVVNFVKLAENGYYEGKRFHRVVPNFVIQTGCNRGDGWGSLEHSIRSELTAMSYDDEGFVGMASAGNHTESSQWFVTHSPTLHLDGNYSIFGKISRGMSTVHSIEIGDVIQSIKINY